MCIYSASARDLLGMHNSNDIFDIVSLTSVPILNMKSPHPKTASLHPFVYISDWKLTI